MLTQDEDGHEGSGRDGHGGGHGRHPELWDSKRWDSEPLTQDRWQESAEAKRLWAVRNNQRRCVFHSDSRLLQIFSQEHLAPCRFFHFRLWDFISVTVLTSTGWTQALKVLLSQIFPPFFRFSFFSTHISFVAASFLSCRRKQRGYSAKNKHK